MRKILSVCLLAAGVGLLASCQKELLPENSILLSTAFETKLDIEAWDNGFNTKFRHAFSGSFVNIDLYQSDLVNLTLNDGNTTGSIHDWVSFNADNRAVEGSWETCYSRIKDINVFLSHCGEFEAKTSEDRLAYYRAVGDAYFFRAYYYYFLLSHFANINQSVDGLGVPIVKELDLDAQPARSTIKECLTFIQDDLKMSEQFLSTLRAKGNPCANLPTIDAIDALRARIAINIKDNAKALATAEKLISSGRYALGTTKADLEEMWKNDNPRGEAIMQVNSSSPDELPGASLGTTFINSVVFQTKKGEYITAVVPLYVPSQTFMDLFDLKDFRRKVYLRTGKQLFPNVNRKRKGEILFAADNINMFYPVMLVSKFPPSPVLKVGGNDSYYHSPMPFRIAEQYLIAAEAAYLSNDVAKATKYLNELRAARGCTPVATSGLDLFKDIKKEWVREMAFEGGRIIELRRWNDPMKRGQEQKAGADDLPIFVTSGLGVEMPAGDHRFTWPIPQSEIQLNPNLVQNPGY